VGRQASGKQVLELKEGDEILGLVVPALSLAAKAKSKAKKSRKAKSRATSEKGSAVGSSPKTKRAAVNAARRSSAKVRKTKVKGRKKS